MRIWKRNNRGGIAWAISVILAIVQCQTALHARDEEEDLIDLEDMEEFPIDAEPPAKPPFDREPDSESRPPIRIREFEGFPPGREGLPPGREGFPPRRDGFPPGGEGFPRGREGFPPGREGFPGRRDGGLPFPGMRRGAPPPNQRARAAAMDEGIHQVVPQKCVPAKGKFIWNFEDEELIGILRQVSDLLCRTIVVNDAIAKNLKMTIIGKSELTPKDAWDVLLAALAAKGLAIIQQGKTWTVIKRSDSKSHSSPMYFAGKQASADEGIGTLFYKAQHAPQEALKNAAKLLVSKDGMVESIGDQFIIVVDSNSNIRRFGEIFSQIDVEDGFSRIHIVTLYHADAKSVEKQIRELFDIGAMDRRARRRRPGPPESRSLLSIDKIIADDNNRLIFIADQESAEKLKEVVALIDQPSDNQSNKGKIYVKKLRFADAKKIAETLNAVVQQGRAGRFPRRRPDERTSDVFEGEVKITSHDSTNTLVTVASANDYRALLATINQLDVRKEQVYVEAVILDIQVNDKSEFGINLFGGIDPGRLGTLGVLANPGGRKIAEGVRDSLVKSGTGAADLSGLGAGGVGALAVLGNFLSGGVAGFVGPTVGPSNVPSFGAVLQALSENSNVDVLSTPYLLTTDNQEAEMSVGEKIPVIRGASSLGGGIGAGLGVPLQNVQHEDVKLTFKITPHVGDDAAVRLDIAQEVNELGAAEEILNNKQYRIRTKSAKTTLVLADQQTGVIGGLISHKTSTADNKVPFLGDIPILGWLFKNRAASNERRSLLLIITPYIIRTDADYKKIVERKLKEREEFSRLYYGGKIKNYNKYIDYDKKAGPLASMLLSVEAEMSKAQNGGPGESGETIIKPQEKAPVPSVSVGAPAMSVSGAEREADDGGEGYDLNEEEIFNDFSSESVDAVLKKLDADSNTDNASE